MWYWYVKLVCETGTGMWNWYVKLVCETGIWGRYRLLLKPILISNDIETPRPYSMAPLDSRLNTVSWDQWCAASYTESLYHTLLSFLAFDATSWYNIEWFPYPICCWTIKTKYILPRWLFSFNRLIKLCVTTKMVIVVNCRHHGWHHRRCLLQHWWNHLCLSLSSLYLLLVLYYNRDIYWFVFPIAFEFDMLPAQILSGKWYWFQWCQWCQWCQWSHHRRSCFLYSFILSTNTVCEDKRIQMIVIVSFIYFCKFLYLHYSRRRRRLLRHSSRCFIVLWSCEWVRKRQ